jgi:hypothetical protein
MQMKFALLSALISLAFVAQAFAVLRPLFPAKPAPPFEGELITIGNDSVLGLKENKCYISGIQECRHWLDENTRLP